MAYTYVIIIWLLLGVCGPQTGGTVTVSVMEGDSVTLHTEPTEILINDHILWFLNLNSSDICIAEMYMHAITFPDGNEIFRDRLHLDYKTGSLTIKNISTAHGGFYELTIVSASKASNKIFIVNVYAVNVSHVTLSWHKGNSLSSSVNVSGPISRVSLPLEIECLGDSYSCVLNNPISNRTKSLNSTELCQQCPEHVHCCDFTEAVIRLVISAAVGVATVAIVVYDFRSRRTEQRLKVNIKI